MNILLKILFIFLIYSWIQFSIFDIGYSGLNAQELTQTIRGKVTDQQSKYPLPGANVIILNSDPLIGFATDIDGYFKLENVPLGRHTIRVSYLGYNERIIPNVLVTSGKEHILKVELSEMVIVSEEVVITAKRDKTKTNNEMTTVSARGFTIEETMRYAGTWNDPSRMVANYAGVISNDDSRNDIIIRGNSPLGLLWRLDGIDIPNPNHFGTFGATGGPVPILNNNNLEDSDFITAAWPAEYGNSLSGVFDLKMRSGNNYKREHMLQIGFNGLEVGVEGPFSKKSKASYLVNYRYSTLVAFKALGIDYGTEAVPQYQDVSFKIDVPGTKYGRFSLFGIGGISYIELEARDFDPKETIYGFPGQDITFSSDMGVIGLSHLYFLNKTTYSKVSIATSATKMTILEKTYELDSITGAIIKATDDTTYGNRFSQVKYSLHYQLNKKFNARNNVNIGFNINLYNMFMNDSALYKPNDSTMQYVTITDFDGYGILSQSYIQWQHRLTDKITFNSGLHFQLFHLNNTFVAEPRFGVKYSFNPSQSINFGLGMHSQMQPLQLYFLKDSLGVKTNKGLEFTKSNHVVLGYDNSLTDNLRIRLEAYYQKITKAPVEKVKSSFSMLNAGADFGIPTRDNLVNNGTGTNYGIEMTLEKFYSNNYYFLVTSSLFNSKYTASDGQERNTAFNGNFVVNALAGNEINLGKKYVLSFNLKTTLAGGKRLTPIDKCASNNAGETVYLNNMAFSEKQKNYFTFNAKVSLRHNGKKVMQEWYIDISNIFSTKNVFIKTWSPDPTLENPCGIISTSYQQGFFPLVQYKIQF